jgi:hypothetical protein
MYVLNLVYACDVDELFRIAVLTDQIARALVPIRFSTAHIPPYGTRKSSNLQVSTSRVLLPAALTSNCSKSQLPSTPIAYYSNSQLLLLAMAHSAPLHGTEGTHCTASVG